MKTYSIRRSNQGERHVAQLCLAYRRALDGVPVSGPATPDAATPRLPRIGEPAIPFRLRTTLGERSLDDYRGRWLMLFSHPADFTPVCTSEFIAFAKAYDRFQALRCDLLGLSVDSLFAHLGWIRSIRDQFGVAELLRALAALQETDASGLSTLADWQPGEPGVLAPPLTLAEADERDAAGATAWYYLPQPSHR